ncbi:pilus assembly protein TadG-related protein [Brachybacterium sp. J153]|uniref:pilus assembly protein TadG-related protein n=1 Tax=Brachybacterium sp. J153 TaxID=3116488 RepID=UPI002E776476|nr:pilus assembly protein TadG-related protein [Brachybacterium sp. J153]MEE1616939.1 pilus assembly protein TadG-related protein [Brachybacterium sp. J153]
MRRRRTATPSRSPHPRDRPIRRAARALRLRLAEATGSMTLLTTGVLVVVLMVIGVGTAITGVQLERTALQHAADAAALAGSQAVDPSRIYDSSDGPVIHPGSARRAAQDHLASYPLDSSRTHDLQLADVSVDDDGTVRVVLTARTDPPLAGWFTRGTGTSVPLTVEGEARSR